MVTDEEVKSLMIAMKKRYDLDFTNYEPRSLGRGISRLMSKHRMTGMIDLWDRVLRDDDFFLKSIDDLMVNLTELFRNPDAWMMIKNEVYPKYKSAQSLKIWHAGCSTGEEIYTNAIVLNQCDLMHKTRILATDLSTKALEKAKTGHYSKNELKNYRKPFLQFFPDKDLEEFFDVHDNYGTIKPKFKRNINFLQNNLVEQSIDQKFDIIFCRNVLIYFDGELKARVLNYLENSLNDGGYLILGYYDTMPNQSIDIFDVYSNSTRIYKKKSYQTVEI